MTISVSTKIDHNGRSCEVAACAEIEDGPLIDQDGLHADSAATVDTLFAHLPKPDLITELLDS